MINERHRSFWHEDADQSARERYKGHQPLQQHATVDVAVVGAGIVGLTTALMLKRLGRTVAVLEAERVGSGTSGSTTAHLTALHDHGYRTIEKAYGPDKTRLLREAMTEAIDLVDSLVHELGIDCDFRRVPGYLFTEKDADVQAFNEELDAARRAGLPAVVAADVPLPFATRFGIEVRDQARMHPLRYLHGLARAVDGEGCRIYEMTRVTDVHDGHVCRVATARGYAITARDVILATHVPPGVSALQAALPPFRSFVLAARVAEQPADALYWDGDHPYHYIRLAEDADGRPLVLVGGEDIRTAHDDEHAALARLESWTRARFAVEDVVARWSAQLYDPADHLPSIGRSPLHAHTYVATGFSGEGMTLGTIAGHVLAEQTMGHETAYDQLFRPARLRREGIARVLEGQLDIARHFVGDRVRADRIDLASLPRGQGVVVKTGGRHVAAFCDESGDVRTFSAVCPHLRCIVHWNDEQGTFDCPCHGSRFDTRGRVLEGPAMRGLAPVARGDELDRLIAARRDADTWQPNA